MGTSAIVASMIPIAVGYAFAEKMKGTNNLTVVFLGDGATDEGVFYESINFASLKKLKILFVVENNEYAIHSHIKDRSCSSILIKTQGFIDNDLVDYNIFNVYNKTKEIIEIIREKNMPFLLECQTHRYMEHVGVKEDWDLGYREKEKEKLDFDQFYLLNGMLMNPEFIEEKVNKKIENAIKFAEDSPFPKRESLYENL